MKRLVLTLAASAIALSTGSALAGATIAEGSHEKLRAHWAWLHGQGGYGYPWVAVPEAVVATVTGKDSGKQVTQGRSGQSSAF